jgi:hypothetical protein
MSPDDLGEGPSKEDLEDLSKKLESEEGMKELEEQLKEMAKEGASGEGEREKELGEAEKGLGDVERQLGVPVPMEVGGPGNKGKGKDGKDGKPGPGGGSVTAWSHSRITRERSSRNEKASLCSRSSSLANSNATGRRSSGGRS